MFTVASFARSSGASWTRLPFLRRLRCFQCAANHLCQTQAQMCIANGSAGVPREASRGSTSSGVSCQSQAIHQLRLNAKSGMRVFLAVWYSFASLSENANTCPCLALSCVAFGSDVSQCCSLSALNTLSQVLLALTSKPCQNEKTEYFIMVAESGASWRHMDADVGAFQKQIQQRSPVVQTQMAETTRLQQMVGKKVWLYLDPWDSVRLRAASTHRNVPQKYGPHGELFFFLLKNEPMVLSELVEFGPCVSAETVKACALIGLHMMAWFRRYVKVWLPRKPCMEQRRR